jgi:signal peptidase II
MESPLDHRYARVGALIIAILTADILSKQWALRELAHGYTVFALEGKLPMTLAFNTGIAFGVDIPSRWLIIIASFVIIGMLFRLLAQTEETDHMRLVSIGLVQAGAIGNLIDRLRWERGVVDFIGPIDLGFMYWPIFNVADMAITVGAVVLGVSLWREDPVLAAEADRERATALVNE